MLGRCHLPSPLARQCTRLKPLRFPYSTSRVAPATTETEDGEQGKGDWSAPKDPTWAVWKETIGKQFEKPHRPRNWLGGKVVEFVSVCVLVPNQPLTPQFYLLY